MPNIPEYAEGSCIRCGYPLRGLSSARCPECGREFDPADPKTFHAGRPISRLSRVILRPISIIWVGLALVGMSLTLLATRWPTTWRWPMTDLPVYWEMAKNPREKFLTQTDWFYAIGITLTAIVLTGWLLRVLLQFIVAKRLQLRREDRVDQRRRHALIAFAGLATTGIMAFGWPFRVARLWVARILGPKPIVTWRGLVATASAPASPPIPLPDEQKLAVFRAALMDLPTPTERIAGLKLLIEEYPGSPLPTLLDALQMEREPSVIVWLLRSIGLCKDAKTLSSIEAFQSHKDPGVQVAAVNAIGCIFEKLPKDGVGTLYQDQNSLASSPSIGVYGIAFRGNAAAQMGGDHTLPETTRLRLLEIMVGTTSQELRQAAAYALANCPEDRYKLRVAEWGVWIANGSSYELVAAILEEIPPFVHQTGNAAKAILSERPPLITTVSKPIIHITANRPIAVDLEVSIRHGRPWFAFPMPDDFELLTDESRSAKIPLESLERSHLSNLTDTWEGHKWMKPTHRGLGWASWGNGIVGLGLRWQSLVVMPEHRPWMVEPKVPDDAKYQWWNRLRQVPSSWVWNRGEADRFLYYDGPTKFPPPLTVKRNRSSLAFTVSEEPDRSTVYFNPIAGSRGLQRRMAESVRAGIFVKVDDQNAVGTQVVAPDASGEVALQLDLRGEDQLAGELLNLRIERGLTEPEAMGLIDAWRPQFFHTAGARLILIMSSADYETLCPIKVRPAPTEMVRVGIILTEFGDATSQG